LWSNPKFLFHESPANVNTRFFPTSRTATTATGSEKSELNVRSFLLRVLAGC
jgi:hypothetical protein